MNCLLDRTRESVKAARERGLRGRRVRFSPPDWLRPSDPLFETYARADALLRTGDVVWGHVVMANSLLFKPGKTDSPGDVLFAEDRSFDHLLDRLARAANTLFALGQDKPPAEDYRAIVHHLTNDMDRAAKLPVPAAISRGARLFVSTVMFHRAGLPLGLLGSNFLPLLVAPNIAAVSVLPVALWADDLIAAWKDLSEEWTG